MSIRMAGATDKGRRRAANQDSIYYDEAAGLAIVADGIGGRKGGEIASSVAVNFMRETFLRTERISHDELPAFLMSSIQNASNEIFEKSSANQTLQGMGTTLNCLVFTGGKLLIAHVGDSRTYLIDQGNIFQITIDHNVANFIERGWINPQVVQPGAKPEALVKAVGIQSRCEPDVYEVQTKPGQVFLTCSDGLSNMLTDKEIVEIVSANLKQFDDIPRTLIQAANHKGGKDNITIVLSQVLDDGEKR